MAPSLMALPLALLAVLPQSRFLGRVFRRQQVWRWVGGILITCLYCLCIFVGLEGVLEILHPGKLAIGVSAMPLFALLLWTGWLDARWWFSLKPGVAPGNSAKPSGNARSANRNPHDWRSVQQSSELFHRRQSDAMYRFSLPQRDALELVTGRGLQSPTIGLALSQTWAKSPQAPTLERLVRLRAQGSLTLPRSSFQLAPRPARQA